MRRSILTGLTMVCVVVGCGETFDDGAASDSDVPSLSDSATIWCDENRWQVVGRASQLSLESPSQANPPWIVVEADAYEEMGRIEAERTLGHLTIDEARAQLATIREALEDAIANYESGEWHRTGVLDDPWNRYRAEEPTAFARACRAAFDLRPEGGS